MDNHEKLHEHCLERELEVLTADGLAGALLGYVEDPLTGAVRAVYSKELAVQELVATGMTPSDAWEYLEFNTFNTYVGPGTPLWATRVEDL